MLVTVLFTKHVILSYLVLYVVHCVIVNNDGKDDDVYWNTWIYPYSKEIRIGINQQNALLPFPWRVNKTLRVWASITYSIFPTTFPFQSKTRSDTVNSAI